MPTRRDFLKSSSLAAILASSAVAAPADVPIIAARLGEPVGHPEVHGDVWTNAWADDGNICAVSDDTTGFRKACNSNLAVHRITGDTPPNLQGETVNPMSQFGKVGFIDKADGTNWKASGFASIDGVLYLAVSHHIYADERGHSYWSQDTWDASNMKSEDRGKTWSATPTYGHAMFPGRSFSNPYFIQHLQHAAVEPARQRPGRCQLRAGDRRRRPPHHAIRVESLLVGPEG